MAGLGFFENVKAEGGLVGAQVISPESPEWVKKYEI